MQVCKQSYNSKNTFIYIKGYVPGNKFKFGNTFYRETINVKEVDVPISTTWGGSLSLFN